MTTCCWVGLGDKSCLIDDNGYEYAELNLPAAGVAEVYDDVFLY
ncbi:MAG: hypothetical protein ACLR8Y_00220 [Alistipes indistinctus]